MAVPKNPVSGDNIKAADELDGNIVCVEGGNLESQTDAQVLETPGISEDTAGDDLSSESTELTAITLHQPWASLVAKGWKQYETRDWPTNHRGSIVIHAGRKPKGKQELREHDKVVASFKDLLNEDCPYSSVIAIAELTDVICMTEEFIKEQSATELRCGNWAVGRYAFKLENVRAIEPIPATGKQGLWKWKVDLESGKYDGGESEKDSQVLSLRKRFFELLLVHRDASAISKSDELEPWNPNDFGELHHVAEADGQLNLLEWVDKEPPEPSDYSSIELFNEAYKQWVDAQTDEAEEELANFGVEELKSNQFKPWLQTEEGKAKAAEFGATIEPPDPNDYEFREQFEEDYKKWVDAQPDENLANFKEVETWNQLMDGSICVQELGPASPMPESNCGEEALTTSASGTAIADQSLSLDSPASTESTTSKNATLNSAAEYNSSQQALPALPSQLMETDSEPMTLETASPMCSEESENCSPTSQLSKTLPASLPAPIPPATNPEPTSDLFSTPYPRAGTMRNGSVLPARILPPPGVESESLLLRSPGGLSGSPGVRPPGKSRLETQLNQLGLIQDGEVAAPEFLEAGYHLPIGFTNLAENRSAMELSQVQAQQSSIVPKSELPAEMVTTETDEKHSGTRSTGESPLSDSSELIISLNLPPNIGALTKNELISMAGEQHQFISRIERKELELALEKLYRARLIGVYLQEFKKKCQYGEFQNQLKEAGIGERSAQNYLVIAKNWEIIESKAQFVALLSENNERPSLTINWALQAVRDEKKQLKSAAPPKDPDGWKTPDTKDQPVVSLVKKALGGQIYLDPCSDSGCNIPATMRYFQWNDGLASHNIWEKTVFINPPFSDPFPWVERCCFEIARGSVSAAVMLLKAGVISNVGTGELINKYASAICHWRGRINFLNDEGNAVKGSDFDCVLVYFGARLDLFRDAFGGRGTIATIENHYSSVNKKHLLKSEVPQFGNTQAEQKQLAAAVGLGNGRSGVLPDMRDRDRELAERHDPYTVVDVLSVPPMSTSTPTPAPTTPVSENLIESLGEVEIFDETPLATRQFETAKQNCLNDYITAISSNLSDFSDDQIAFLAKIINEESVKRIGF